MICSLPLIINIQFLLAQPTSPTGESTTHPTLTTLTKRINHLPAANNDSARTDEDTTVNINVLANDSDIDGDSLNVTSVIAAPKNGTAEFNKTSQIITYTPNTNFSGEDSFEYNVSDGNKGGLDTGTVTISVNEALEVVKSFFEEKGIGINIDQKTLLKVLFEHRSPIPEGPSNIHIEGQLIGTNGSGISGEDISVVFHGPNTDYQHTAKTDASGHFDFSPNAGNNIPLDKGIYVANASATKIGNLKNSAQLIVVGRAPSVPPEIWYSLFGLVPAFLIPSSVSAVIGWIQRRNLRQYRKIIDHTYYTFEKSHKERQECLDRLDELEMKITDELEKKILGISQTNYDLLMRRISDFKDKMKNTSS